jgi:hypothetical protein
MNIYTYKFQPVGRQGSETGGWELHLMHNGDVVEVVGYPSGDTEAVDHAVKRGQEWVAERERNAPP